MAGWVYLSGSVISLAAVALALQATLPQIAPVFQLIGDAADRSDCAKNAVLLGCLLIGLTTVINSVGVRLMARINNVGVIAELIGVTVLIALARGEHPPRSGGLVRYARPRRRPAGRLPGPIPGGGAHGLVRLVRVRHGRYPGRRDRPSPAAALPGRSSRPSPPPDWPARCSCSSASSRSAIPRHPELGRISGGLPFLVKDVLGPRLGVFLLLEVIFAVFVCALAVHAGSVRLMFAMARDNNLPFAHSLAHVQAWSKAPIVPSVVVGVLAAAILVVNINLPNVIETLCSVAIVWANLAYLLVTMPLLLARLRRGGHRRFCRCERRFKPSPSRRRPTTIIGEPLLFAGSMGTARQRDRGGLGALRRDQHRLASRRRSTAPAPGAASRRPWRRSA